MAEQEVQERIHRLEEELKEATRVRQSSLENGIPDNKVANTQSRVMDPSVQPGRPEPQGEKRTAIDYAKKLHLETGLTAKQLHEAWQSNKAKVKADYHGKVIKLTGTVDSVAQDELKNEYYVVFQDTSDQFSKMTRFGVRCHFADESDLGGLRKGQVITVTGEVRADDHALDIRQARMVGSVPVAQRHAPTRNLTAKRLHDAWQSNKAKVKADYHGKKIELTGVVDSVEQDLFMKSYHVVFQDSPNQLLNLPLYGLNCHFADENVLGGLKKGQVITVTGEVRADGHTLDTHQARLVGGAPATQKYEPNRNLTAKQLHEAWRSNKAKVKADYHGKVIKLTGTVDSVEQDVFKKEYYVVFQDSSDQFFRMPLFGIHCHFADGNALAGLRKGQVITVSGEVRADDYTLDIREVRMVGNAR
jgi:hypothetical protein